MNKTLLRILVPPSVCTRCNCNDRIGFTDREIWRYGRRLIGLWVMLTSAFCGVAMSLAFVAHAQSYQQSRPGYQSTPYTGDIQVTDSNVSNLRRDFLELEVRIDKRFDKNDKDFEGVDDRLRHIESNQTVVWTVFGTINFLFMAGLAIYGLRRKQ